MGYQSEECSLGREGWETYHNTWEFQIGQWHGKNYCK
jgi:hypothetical protein